MNTIITTIAKIYTTLRARMLGLTLTKSDRSYLAAYIDGRWTTDTIDITKLDYWRNMADACCYDDGRIPVELYSGTPVKFVIAGQSALRVHGTYRKF